MHRIVQVSSMADWGDGRLGLGPYRPLFARAATRPDWPIGARPLSATFGPFGHSLTRPARAPPPRHDRSGSTESPRLRTLGRTVRRIGTLIARFGGRVPFLRTHGRTVRKNGTLASLFSSRVPNLRTLGRTVRKIGTMGCLGGARAVVWPRPKSRPRASRRPETS